MKKILLIPAVIILAVACHKEPYTDSDNEYLVYTSPGKQTTFTSFQTFDLADSLLIIGQIKQILAHAPAVSSGNKGSGVGVYNVDHRIKLLYGEKYGISIDSELDEGTTVRILIPKVSGSVE